MNRPFTIGLVAIGLVATACGSDAPLTAPSAPASTTVAPAVAPAASGASVTGSESSLGSILVGERGLTVYGFTNDSAASSTCTGACADAWPPLVVGEDWSVAPGLDLGIFATTVRDDGQLQLVAGKWPLYYFAGDIAPGDVNGQGSGDVWFVVGTDGILIADAAAAQAGGAAVGVLVGQSNLGEILTDQVGLSLYGFKEDVDGVPSCEGACADAWPPLITATADLPADLDPTVFSVVQRSDGSFQLRAGAWPLYRFAGDAAPGDSNGQGSGDVWFLAAPDGSLLGGAGSADDSASSSGDGSYGSADS